jgi:TPR repeat protein
VLRDAAEAARWYRKAAEAGSAEAQYNLALLYDRGRGVERDMKRAAELYEQAADGGVIEAWVALSVLYAGGIGVAADPVKALMWLEMATAAGVATDPAFREALTAGMSEEEQAEARRLAFERLQRNPAAQPSPIEPPARP